MYCRKCGQEINEGTRFCPNCGCNLDLSSDNQSTNKGLDTATRIFFILAMAGSVLASLFCSIGIIVGFIAPSLAGTMVGIIFIIYTIICLIPLCWVIPMYKHFVKCRKENIQISIAFKICTLIFVNVIAGILILIREE